MDGQELYDLNTEIRGGRALDETTFYVLANLAKAKFERSRAWRKLVKKNSDNSATSSTTNATEFTLPTGFIKTLPRRTMKLVNSSGAWKDYTEVPFERWDEYKTQAGCFTIDHLNSKFYLGGTVDQTYTINFYHSATTTALATAVTWIFPEEFHPYIAFEVAVMDELGMDYDEKNARQGNANSDRAEMILRSAIKWDDALARSSLGI